MAYATTGWQVRSHRWQLRALEMIVERERENRSEIVRQALTEYLERHYPDDVARARGSDA